MRLPPTPKWNKATDSLEDAQKSGADYERSLLPPGTVFPRVGQLWETVRDCELHFIAWFAFPSRVAPQGGGARLDQRERVRIHAVDDANKPLHVTFLPLRYEVLHESIVPEEIRKTPGYAQYALTLRTVRTPCCAPEETAYFNELFRLVEEVD